MTEGGWRVIAHVSSTEGVPPQSFHSGWPARQASICQAALSIIALARRFSGTPSRRFISPATPSHSTPTTFGIRKSSNAAASERGDTPVHVALIVPSATPSMPSASVSLSSA